MRPRIDPASSMELPPRFLLGVSGGIDSVSLLHALTRTPQEIIVCHFNHGWRPESVSEARWVKALAQHYNCPFLGGRAPTKTAATESLARMARWKFFQTCAQKSDCPHLVLAHHADDQVETFLLQLLRGSGSQWSGIKPRQRHGPLTVYRPWLHLWRSQIQDYAQAQQLSWKEDPSNSDPHHQRNRLRLEILPILEKFAAPGLRQRLWQTSEIQQAQASWLESLVEEESKDLRLSVAKLRALHPGHVRTLLKAWLTHHQIENLSYDDIQSATLLLHQVSPAKLNLSKGKHLRRQKGWLFIE